MDPLTVDLVNIDPVNIDPVNTDVIKGHDDVSIWQTPCCHHADVSRHSLVLPRVVLSVFLFPKAFY